MYKKYYWEEKKENLKDVKLAQTRCQKSFHLNKSFIARNRLAMAMRGVF
jgi:hypothetical protein